MSELEMYRHYKGNYYTKLYEAQHSETDEILVIYASCDDGKIYARPKEMFYDKVDTKNYYGPRFFKIERKGLNG